MDLKKEDRDSIGSSALGAVAPASALKASTAAWIAS
jgi:hypothetical protein